MAVDPNDWRLAILGRAEVWRGLRWTWKRYVQPRPDWDHDHCIACTAKVTDAEDPDVLQEAFASEGDRFWVCRPCFDDFAGAFGWTETERERDPG